MKWKEKDAKRTLFCNFTLEVIGVDSVYINGSEKYSQYIQVRIAFRENVNKGQKIYNIPIDKIDKMHWKELNVHCRYNPEIPESKVERYLNDHIRAQIGKAPRRVVESLNSAGMYKIDGQPIFYTGKVVIQSPTKKTTHVIKTELSKENLDINNELSESDAAKEIVNFISLSPEAGQILLAYKLGCLTRMAYEDAGKVAKGCIYLYGETGMQKTTFSSLMIQTYNRSKGIKSPQRLSASIPAAVQILKEKAGDVAILDDLFPAESGRIRNQMEETFGEIVRYIADGTLPARMRGKKLSQETPKCGVIFTGEYIIGKGSDAARILPVKMVKPNGKKLQYFQEHPVNISTFYYYYISWFIEHYDEACKILKEIWNKYEDADLGVHDRLREMHFFLSTAYFLFLQYRYNKGFLKDADAIMCYKSFNAMLTKLIRQQNERVQSGIPKQFTNVDYLRTIRELYISKQFHTAYNIAAFDETHHDSVIWKECLWFRGECLNRFFPDINPKEIISELEQKNILQVGKDKKTKQLHLLKGKRFYVIPLRYLT